MQQIPGFINHLIGEPNPPPRRRHWLERETWKMFQDLFELRDQGTLDKVKEEFPYMDPDLGLVDGKLVSMLQTPTLHECYGCGGEFRGMFTCPHFNGASWWCSHKYHVSCLMNKRKACDCLRPHIVYAQHDRKAIPIIICFLQNGATISELREFIDFGPGFEFLGYLEKQKEERLNIMKGVILPELADHILGFV